MSIILTNDKPDSYLFFLGELIHSQWKTTLQFCLGSDLSHKLQTTQIATG